MFVRFVLSSFVVCNAIPWTAPEADTPTVDVTLGASDDVHPEVMTFITHAEAVGESNAVAAMKSDVAAFNSELRSAKLRIATAAGRFVSAMRSQERQQVKRGAAFLSPPLGSTIEIDVAAPTQVVDFASVSSFLNKFESQLSSAENDLFSTWSADFRSLTDFVVNELEKGTFVAAAPAAGYTPFGSAVGEGEPKYQTVSLMLEGLGSRRGTAVELALANHLRLQVSLVVRENEFVREALRVALAAADF